MRDLIAVLQATRNGAGWSAKCPAHDDQRASLSIGRGEDWRWLVKCHAGCDLDAILAAAHLERRDLFAETPPTRQIVATYAYHDQDGAHLFDVVRYSPKDFRQRRADGVWRMAGVRRVLYHLPELQGLSTAYLTEGEKDADRLRAIGLPGTCNPGGAGKWTPAYTAQLQAAAVERVVILPDHDDAGRQHAETVARSCHAAGLTVKVIALPDLPRKGDVSDWLDAGHTKAYLAAIVSATPVYVPAADVSTARDALDLVVLADVAPERVEWIWPGRVARGKYTLISGDPGLGKSTLSLAVASALSRGAMWPDGSGRAPHGTTLVLSAEDGIGDTMRPRVDRLGGDPSQIVVLRAVRDEHGSRPLNLARDLDRLAEAVARVTPTLVIIDPITAYLGKTDSYKDAEVRGLLAPLTAVIEDARVGLLAVGHLAKAAQLSALHRPGGSIAFVAAARIVLCLAADPADPDRRILAGLKSNLAPLPPSLAFRLPDGRLEWEHGAVSLDAEALLRPSSPHDRDEQTDAEAVLADLLAEAIWPLDAKEALAAGQAHGIAERTLRWTAKRLGIQIRREGFGKHGRWLWHRPAIPATGDTSSPHVAPIAPMEDHATKGQSFSIEAMITCTKDHENGDGILPGGARGPSAREDPPPFNPKGWM